MAAPTGHASDPADTDFADWPPDLRAIYSLVTARRAREAARRAA
jgi:hypothetical protein